MNRFFLAVLIAGMSGFSGGASAQEPQTPGAEHKELKALEGTWDAVLKMTDGSESKAVAEYRMICEGMWLQSDFRGDFGGVKFHGRGLDSYDSSLKKYTSVWVDSMSGSPMTLTGTMSGKTITMTGEGPGPGGVAKYKTVSVHESADRMTFQMFIVADSTETEMMKVIYTRRK